MVAWRNDTHPEVQRRMDAGYRALPFERKLNRVAQLNAMVRGLALQRIAAQHPTESEREHRLRLLVLTTPRDVVERLIGPLPKAL